MEKTIPYDAIASEYRESKKLLFRSYIEEYSIFKMLPDLAGKTILDLACGEGVYSRKLKRSGADRVVGVDLSPAKIELTRQSEREDPLGIEYQVKDVGELGVIQAFDHVLASFLFNYARSEAELMKLCQSAYQNLKPHGSLIGINDNPADNPEFYPNYRKYGFTKTASRHRQAGDPITYTAFNADGTSFHFDNFYLHPSTYERVFAQVGFREFKWIPLNVSPEGITRLPLGHWDDFLKSPPFIGIKAVR